MRTLLAGGLTDSARVASADAGDVVVRLTASGHDRGILAGLIAERLQTAMQAVAAGQLDALPDALARGDQDSATKILGTVRGIGPKVAPIALMLMK